MPHSHIDVEWYWTFDTTRQWTREILDKAMALLRRDPEYRFTQDQVVLVKSYWEGLSEEERAEFRRMVEEGRLAIVGGMYVQPEVAEPSGESLVRQILFGQRWLVETFGKRARCGWFIDTFGQVPQLPQILSRAGFDAYVFWRDVPPNFPIDTLPADFWCESPDGSRILTHWLAGGYSTNDGQVRAAVDHSRTGEVLLPFGSDVSRPTQDSPAMRQSMQERLGKVGVHDPQLRISTAPEYFDRLRASRLELPVVRLDFNPPQRAQDLRGTYDNRIELKKLNRAAEQGLYSAECLAAIASFPGGPYPQALFRGAWEKLLFSHFHDIMGGSHSDPVYVGARERLRAVIETAEESAQGSLKRILAGTASSGQWLAVYNTLSFPRSELCRVRLPSAHSAMGAEVRVVDEAGRSIPFRRVSAENDGGDKPGAEIEFVADSVPAMGFRAYQVCSGRRRVPRRGGKLGANFIENQFFRLEWNTGSGDVLACYDKRLGCELLAGPSNVVVLAKEKSPDLEGTLHLTGEETRSSDQAALVIRATQDELGLRLRAATRLADCLLEREIVLYDQLERIDFRTTLNNFRGGDVLIKVSFAPRFNWSGVRTVYETPFAATPRPEGHFAAQTWVDCSEESWGIALLNRGTPGYWIGQGKLELVLLRSFANYTSYRANGLRKRVPGYEHSTQTELAREHGTHKFQYALVPHVGEWRQAHLAELGRSYNTPLLSLAGLHDGIRHKARKSFLRALPDFDVTAFKGAEDGKGWILRGYETRGETHDVTIELPKGISRVQRVSLLEEPMEALQVRRGTVALRCRPHEIVTLRLQ